MSVRPEFLLAALLSAVFCLATALEPSLLSASRNGGTEGLIAAVLGDGRKLFAQHFYIKADAYFHSGYYPSIFEQARTARQAEAINKDVPKDTSHESKPHAEHDGHHEGEAEDDHEDELQFLAKPANVIERFGRYFFPSHHSHMESKAEQEEILPWLRLAAEMDPGKAEVYAVSAYWLRTRMGRVDEAEAFLREGWRNNPDSPQILYELGRLYQDGRRDAFRARNVWTLGVERWQRAEASKPQPDLLTLQQLFTGLIRLDEQELRWADAARKLESLKSISPNPEKIEALRKEYLERAAAAHLEQHPVPRQK